MGGLYWVYFRVRIMEKKMETRGITGHTFGLCWDNGE